MSAEPQTSEETYLATRGGSADPVRPETYYRFSVKCTRDQNTYLEKQAAEIGMTVNELVQSAMDALMAGYEPSTGRRKAYEKWKASVSAETVERVMALFIEKMDVRGRLSFKISDMSRELKVDGNTFYAAARALTREGRIERLQAGGFGRLSVFRVIKGTE